MDSFCLYALTEEIKKNISGARVNKIFQINEFFVFRLSNKKDLIINISNQASGICLDKNFLENPLTPPAFCMLLRKYLTNSFITELSSIKFYRECCIKFKKKHTLWELIIVFSPKNRNLILKQDNIIANFNNFLLAEKEKIHFLSKEEFKEKITSKDLKGFPKFLINEFLYIYETESLDTAYNFYSDIYAFKKDFTPVMINNKPYPFILKHLISNSSEIKYFSSFNEMFISILKNLGKDISKKSATQHIQKEIKKIKKTLKKIEAEITEKKDYERLFKYGELLKANIYKIKKGDKNITVKDYFQENFPEITIPLKQDKSPQENVEFYFKQGKKFKRGLTKLKERKKELNSKLKSLENSNNFFSEPLYHQKKQPNTTDSNALYKEAEFNGIRIIIGKSSKGNEFIIKNFGKPDYLWFHAKDYPGSHVIITEKEENISSEVIRFAAEKAFENSKAKNNGKGDVIYTKIKYLKKPKGAPPGLVSVKKFKTVFVFN